MKIIICDDSQQNVDLMCKTLRELFISHGQYAEFFTFTDGNDVIKMLVDKKSQADVIFLDIDMPKITGLQTAAAIRKAGVDILLIFVSAHEHYVFESIEFMPFRYIRKNRIKEELPLAVNAILTAMEANSSNSYTFRTEEGETHLNLKDILKFEIVQRKVEIALANGKSFLTRTTIKELSKTLPEDMFVKIHSGCIANVRHISSYNSSDVILDDGTSLPVSRRNLQVVKDKLIKYWGDNT